MSTCGGSVSTQTVPVGTVHVTLAGADDNRQTLAVKAGAGNVGTVWIHSRNNGRVGDGWPLAAGEGYVFGGNGGGALDSRGARPALYAIGTDAADVVHVLTEGA